MKFVNLEDVLKLSERGFTPEQIMALTKMAPVADDPEPVQPEPVQPEPKQDTLEETQPEPAPAEPDTRIEQLQSQINDLIRQMQSNNLKTASINVLPDDDLEKATDEAMAELIRPTIKKEGILR